MYLCSNIAPLSEPGTTVCWKDSDFINPDKRINRVPLYKQRLWHWAGVTGKARFVLTECLLNGNKPKEWRQRGEITRGRNLTHWIITPWVPLHNENHTGHRDVSWICRSDTQVLVIFICTAVNILSAWGLTESSRQGSDKQRRRGTFNHVKQLHLNSGDVQN